MAKPLIAAIFLLASSLCGAALADAVPESGAMRDGAYENAYFGFALKLPSGWSAGPEGPRPSLSGYYVLANLVTAAPEPGSVLIAAQDLFFGDKGLPELRMDLSLRGGVTADTIAFTIRIFSKVLGDYIAAAQPDPVIKK